MLGALAPKKNNMKNRMGNSSREMLTVKRNQIKNATNGMLPFKRDEELLQGARQQTQLSQGK